MSQPLPPVFSFAENEQRIDKLIDNLHTGVLVTGPHTEVLFCNQAALLMLGLTEDELCCRSSFHPDWNVIREDGSPFELEEQPVPKCISTKKAIANVIMGIYRPITKDRAWLLVSAAPVFTDYNEVKEVVCSFSDITEQKQTEEKLTWLYQKLEIRAFELANTNADLERFVYVATHDLQEPLRMVSSFTQLLRKKYEGQLDERAIDYINYAVEGATRLKKLILSLLEFSKFSSNHDAFSVTDMNEVVKSISLKFSNELKSVGAQLTVAKLPTINANNSLIVQLIDNLVSNALKYRSERPLTIDISFCEQEEQFVFSVADNGIGIHPGYFEKIFILFQRLQNGTGEEDGVGAGLAVCKKIAELHHGQIWVESVQGKGSTFYFSISKKQFQTYEKL